jgi:tol-pal system protein YbgF
MSPRLHTISRAVVAAAVLALAPQGLVSQALAQDADLELRIQRLENQLRQVTGQNEELQYRNRQLEERLRQLGAAPPGAPGAQPPAAAQPNVAAVPPAQANPGYRQPAYPQQGGYQQPQPGYPAQQPAYPQQQGPYEQPQIAAPAPIMQEPASSAAGNRRRGDAFDPTQNPNAPGAPKALGGGQLPIGNQAAAAAPGGRAPGEPLDLGSVSPRAPGPAVPPAQAPTASLTTLPPSATPRDEFDLGIGYMQRKDYALAEETMKNFAQKYPSDPLIADSKYWLGESYFQRQQYREAAQAFLGVTSDYEKSAKAPDAMLRLGQSLAALKEKEAACAAFGAVIQKYPRASAGVKAAVDREQKRVKC